MQDNLEIELKKVIDSHFNPQQLSEFSNFLKSLSEEDLETIDFHNPVTIGQTIDAPVLWWLLLLMEHMDIEIENFEDIVEQESAFLRYSSPAYENKTGFYLWLQFIAKNQLDGKETKKENEAFLAKITMDYLQRSVKGKTLLADIFESDLIEISAGIVNKFHEDLTWAQVGETLMRKLLTMLSHTKKSMDAFDKLYAKFEGNLSEPFLKDALKTMDRKHFLNWEDTFKKILEKYLPSLSAETLCEGTILARVARMAINYPEMFSVAWKKCGHKIRATHLRQEDPVKNALWYLAIAAQRGNPELLTEVLNSNPELTASDFLNGPLKLLIHPSSAGLLKRVWEKWGKDFSRNDLDEQFFNNLLERFKAHDINPDFCAIAVTILDDIMQMPGGGLPRKLISQKVSYRHKKLWEKLCTLSDAKDTFCSKFTQLVLANDLNPEKYSQIAKKATKAGYVNAYWDIAQYYKTKEELNKPELIFEAYEKIPPKSKHYQTVNVEMAEAYFVQATDAQMPEREETLKTALKFTLNTTGFYREQLFKNIAFAFITENKVTGFDDRESLMTTLLASRDIEDNDFDSWLLILTLEKQIFAKKQEIAALKKKLEEKPRPALCYLAKLTANKHVATSATKLRMK